MGGRVTVTLIEISFGPIINVLILVVLVSIVTHFLRIPYTVALIFGGLLASLFSPFSLPQFSPEVFLTLLLPPLIFQAATKVNLGDVRKDGVTIFSYAFVGTLLSIALVGVFSHLVIDLNFFKAMLLGAILSPTDAVAVISILKKLG